MYIYASNIALTVEHSTRASHQLEGTAVVLQVTDWPLTHVSADLSKKQVPTEEGLTRDFLLSCALSPMARQRPADLSLDRTEDWVQQIVLVNVSILKVTLSCYKSSTAEGFMQTAYRE